MHRHPTSEWSIFTYMVPVCFYQCSSNKHFDFSVTALLIETQVVIVVRRSTSSSAAVSNVRSAGRIRQANWVFLARKMILQSIKMSCIFSVEEAAVLNVST